MNKFGFIFILYLFIVNCNNNSNDSKIRDVYYLFNRDSSAVCSYAISKSDNILLEYYCQIEGVPHGKMITYYSGGIAKTLENYELGILNGLVIKYYNSGIVKEISSYQKGLLEGELRLYSPTGVLEEIRFAEHDSIYYLRRFTDTVHYKTFNSICKPLCNVAKDTFQISDSVEFHIRFPLPKQYNLESLGFQLRYDRFPINLANGKVPYAKFSTPLDREDIYIGITSKSPSADRFVYYVTDSLGNTISPNLYKDVFFVSQIKNDNKGH